MGTPLYNTDIIPLTSRPTLTVMDDGDYFAILDTSTGKISKILRTDVQKALSISYDNTTSGLTAENVQAALDELVVDLGSADDAITAIKGVGYTDGTLKTHEDRLDTLEGDDTTEGSVAKSIKDAVEPIETRLDSTELTLARQGQDLASVKQALQQGNGATLDFEDIGIVPLDARVTGRANPTVEGLTATNIIDGAGIAHLGTVTFASVLDHKYFDVLHGTILTGTGSDMTVTNDTGATADIAVINLTSAYGSGNEPSASDCAKIFSYFDGTKSITLPARVRSVGKNLWDAKKRFSYLVTAWAIPSYASIINDNGRTCLKISYFPAYRSIPLYQYPFIIGQQYTLKFQAKKLASMAGLGVQIVHTDGSSIVKYPNATEYASYTVKSTAGKTISHIEFFLADSGYILIDLDTIQLELGSTATPYEPYKDSTLYISDNEELRSFGATTDLVKVVNGEFVLEKNVNDDATAVISPPITTPLTTSGILQAKPNGTVYFEPYYEGSHQTNASSQITLPYEGTIDKLTGYDENLEPYEVPSTGYTLVGTTLTVTGAVENEVFYVELSRSEPLAPEMGVNVINNDRVTFDTNDGKYYQIGFTTTNGIPTVTATEVV